MGKKTIKIMSSTDLKISVFDLPRPSFPKRAVVTGGMPYGNKKLHFGHVGGVFVQADCLRVFCATVLENVIFVSGTDCYGSPIVESYRKLFAKQGIRRKH